MPPRIPRGTSGAPRPGALPGTTFVELVVTIFLLSAFAAVVFPIFWSASKASAASNAESAAQRSELSLVTVLTRLCAEVHPPYWADPQQVFLESGSELKALYRDGRKDDFLAVQKEGDSRLSLATAEVTVQIDNLPGLSVGWWEKDKRIIGITVQWQRGSEVREFHAAWGAFPL